MYVSSLFSFNLKGIKDMIISVDKKSAVIDGMPTGEIVYHASYKNFLGRGENKLEALNDLKYRASLESVEINLHHIDEIIDRVEGDIVETKKISVGAVYKSVKTGHTLSVAGVTNKRLMVVSSAGSTSTHNRHFFIAHIEAEMYTPEKVTVFEVLIEKLPRTVIDSMPVGGAQLSVKISPDTGILTILSGLFVWGATKEGAQYWSNIAHVEYK